MKRLAIIGLAAALALPAAAFAQTPKRGGTLTYAISAETPTYDCAATDTFAAIHFLAPFYSTLLKFDLAAYPAISAWTKRMVALPGFIGINDLPKATQA